MKISDKNLRLFFSNFNKEISNEEIDILNGKKAWTLMQNKYWSNLLKKISKFKFLFKISPFIKEIFICNNLAFWCAGKKSDIDLFIVCKNNKIWTARCFLTLFTHIFKLRRHDNVINWRFCLSFWITDLWANKLSDIQIDQWKDPYLAIWTATLIPILDTWYFENFKLENKWINDYWLKFVNKKINKNKKWLIKIIFETLLRPNIIEKLLLKIFKKRSLKK